MRIVAILLLILLSPCQTKIFSATIRWERIGATPHMLRNLCDPQFCRSNPCKTAATGIQCFTNAEGWLFIFKVIHICITICIPQQYTHNYMYMYVWLHTFIYIPLYAHKHTHNHTHSHTHTFVCYSRSEAWISALLVCDCDCM